MLTCLRVYVCALLLILSAAIPLEAKCPVGDLDRDCQVGLADVAVLAGQWLEPPEQTADLNGDDDVDMLDLALLAQQWRKSGVSLAINEFMASNGNAAPDPQGEYDDWIEIYNYGRRSIDVGGMYLTDHLSEPNLWRFPLTNPALTTIGEGGYLLVWADRDVGESGLHADFELDIDGEEIGLFDRDGKTLVDSVTFGRQTPNLSLGRYPDGADNWQVMAAPSAGLPNLNIYQGIIEDVKFSHKRGFYSAPFSVTLACETEGAIIYYTLDGAEPYELVGRFPVGVVYTGPIPISRTTCLRAKAIKAGWKASDIATHTYIFVNDVAMQSPYGEAPGSGWPVGSVNGQIIDYGMDPDVVNDPRYANVIYDALLSIPSISLVTKLKNLFDPVTGIYVHASSEGRSWERPTSVELVNPDGSEGFQIDAGVRIRGGFSRSGGNPKHAFRLFFRAEYGDGTLRFPLFGDEGVQEFDCVDLRTAQNYSWSFQGSNLNTMNRDVFSRDTQRDMGQPYTRSRYYHLYIDGQYWGLYQTQERSEASFAQSYFGGEGDDYDVVKNEDSYLSATDGNTLAWERLWNGVRSGVSNQAYYALQGLSQDGTRNPGYEVLLDVDNVIDYMLVIYYSGNLDAPISNFMGNNGLNNFSVIFSRTNPQGFKCFAHDSEHTLLLGNVVGQGDELYRDRTGPFSCGSQSNRFNPQWLHQQLMGHPDYRMRFADHVYKHFFNRGLLTPDGSRTQFMKRANQINMAIIAESARWGDSKTSTPRTKDDDWLPAINNILNNYLPVRTGIVLDQLKRKSWYPSVEPSTFSHSGGAVPSGFKLTMSAPAGAVYYTVNGADPRRSGGAVNTADATVYSKAITISASTKVKARVLSGGTWSALREATFAVGAVAEALRITEIMYHPEDTNSPGDANEGYIELRNISGVSLNLNLVRFTNGVDFTFPNVQLAAGQHILVVKDREAFEAQHGEGLPVAGQYSGSLDNDGERIRLEDAIGRTILDFRYKDGWRPITDGGGFSLTIVDPAGNDPNVWSSKQAWRASAYPGGSPLWDDSGILPNPGEVVVNEVLAHSHAAAPDWIELYNTTDREISVGGWFLSDSETNLEKYEIASGTKIGAHRYLVFYEDLNFGSGSPDPGRHKSFALSESGEAVYLSSAEGGLLTGYRDIQDFGASETGVSFGLYLKSSTGDYDFVSMSLLTERAANSYPKVGPIVISEIMYNPDWPTGGSYASDQYEYVELRNISGSAVTLYDFLTSEPWKFTNGIEFTFPSGTALTIPAGDSLMIVKNPQAFAWRYPTVPPPKILGPYEGKLSDEGEAVELSKPGDVDSSGIRQYILVDKVKYSDGSHPQDCPGDIDLWPVEADGGGMSLTRKIPADYGNDVVNWEARNPSPAW